MTPEESRKLLSGYAAGSLSELEKQLLFDAALEDQELFDELAEEQSIKELIELPGAKQRLIAALEPEQKARAWWPLAVGLAGVASVVVAVVLLRSPTVDRVPVEVAENRSRTAAETAVAVQPEISTQLPDAPPVLPQVLPDAPSPKLEAPPPADAEKETRLAEADAVAAEQARQEAVVETAKSLLRAEAPAVEAPKAPLQPPPAAQAFEAAKGKAAAQGFVGGAAANGIAARAVVGGDALTYEVRETGILRIVPIRTGFLEVTFDTRPLYPTRAVEGGTPVDISIPLEAQQLRIDFALAANAPATDAAVSQETSGMMTLPSTPNPRAAILIPAQRR